MKLDTHSDPALFSTFQPEWNDLVRRSTANQIFSTWEWQSTWWACYQPGDLWVTSLRTDDGQLVGLAPWFIGKHEDGSRFVSTIGCKEVTDYLDLIVDRNHAEAVLDCLAAYVAQNTDRFERLEFCNISQDSISYLQLPASLEKHGFAITLELEDVCPVVQLPETWIDYLGQLDKKQRHELRRKLRRVQGASNTGIDWYIVGTEHDLDTEMEHFFRLMAASDPNKAEFLSDPQNVDFFKRIAAIVHEQGWLQLSFLTINGERVAGYLDFDYEGQILVYNSGLLPEPHGHLSPGIVLLAYNIQHAIEAGRRVFDFLQGDESYKYHMGGQDIQVFNLIATHVG